MRKRLFLVGWTLSILGGCATPLPFAPDVEAYAFYADRDLSAVWSREAVDGYQRRIRLTVRPSLLRESASIRIDVPEHARAVGHVVRTHRGVHDRKITERSTFAISPVQLEQLDKQIARAGLWEFERESWWLKGEDGQPAVCVDGVQLIFERATKEDYRFSEAKAQCGASSELLQVAEQMITMARLDKTGVAAWLR